jgi:hypothetical protein
MWLKDELNDHDAADDDDDDDDVMLKILLLLLLLDDLIIDIRTLLIVRLYRSCDVEKIKVCFFLFLYFSDFSLSTV